MFWQRTSPTRYERPCDANEIFLKTIADTAAPFNREHWVVNTIARIKTDDPDIKGGLSRAWLRTRHRAPFIASLIEGTQLIYKVPDKMMQEKWLKESFFVEEGTVDQFLLNCLPRPYSSLHYFPASSQIVMRLHHWLADGVGSLCVLNILLDLLAANDTSAPVFGDEWERLPPSHHQANGFPDSPSAAAQEYADKTVMDFVGKLPSIALPIEPSQKGLSLGGPKRIGKRFDQNTSAAIVAACRRHQVSVSSATHAALIVAAQEYATLETKGNNYTWFAAFNYRPYLPAPYNDHKTWPTGAYIVGPAVSLPAADFLTQARGMHDFYHQPLRKGETLLFEAYETYNKKLLAAFSAPPPPGSPPPTTPEMSCLGIIDKFVQAEYLGKHNVELLDVEVAVDQISANIISYSWSFKGCLGLSLVYNEAMYKDEWVKCFFERMQNILLEGLGVHEPEAS